MRRHDVDEQQKIELRHAMYHCTKPRHDVPWRCTNVTHVRHRRPHDLMYKRCYDAKTRGMPLARTATIWRRTREWSCSKDAIDASAQRERDECRRAETA